MTLSFMALLVIPELKISDSGLFDGRKILSCAVVCRLELNTIRDYDLS